MGIRPAEWRLTSVPFPIGIVPQDRARRWPRPFADPHDLAEAFDRIGVWGECCRHDRGEWPTRTAARARHPFEDDSIHEPGTIAVVPGVASISPARSRPSEEWRGLPAQSIGLCAVPGRVDDVIREVWEAEKKPPRTPVHGGVVHPSYPPPRRRIHHFGRERDHATAPQRSTVSHSSSKSIARRHSSRARGSSLSPYIHRDTLPVPIPTTLSGGLRPSTS